jgi:hypothetical protein
MANEQVKLYTQADLASLNAQLDVILKNLDAHVNMSLSKAHSIKVVLKEYRDSGGDQINSPFSPATDSIVLEFQFGEPPNNTTIYVPARIVASNTSYVKDPGPRTIGSGITYQATFPTGTSTSPGVPLAQKSLVTTSPAQVALDQSTVYNDLLLMHQLCSVNDVRELQCHGGVSYSTTAVFDSLGHSVGRKVVNIGWGGVLYKLPADTLITGPPQAVRGLRIVTDSSTNPYHNRIHHSKDGSGDGKATLLSFYGNSATIEWQINNSDGASKVLGTTWTVLNTGGVASTGVIPSGFGKPGNWTTAITPSFSLTTTFLNEVDSSEWKHFVRVRATTPEGAVSYSNVCAFSGNDEDGSWDITWYGYVHRDAPGESKWTSWESWLDGASTLYH